MRKQFIVLFSLFLFLWVSAFAAVEEEAPVWAAMKSQYRSVELNQIFYIAIELGMEPGWHTYWKFPGEVGFPLEITWDLPPGFQVGELLWPKPVAFESFGIESFGYEDRAILLAEVKAPEDLGDVAELHLGAQVAWVACSESCLPGETNVDLTLAVARESAEEAVALKNYFTEALKQIPVTGKTVKGQIEGDHLSLEVPETFQGQVLSFVPGTLGMEAVEGMEAGEQLQIPIDPKGVKSLENLGGILVAEGGEEALIWEFSVEAGNDTQVLPPREASEADMGMGLVLVLAFLGGLILNIMPCVLPVISLKILSFVTMAEKKRFLVFQHGLAFTVGVLLSFWTLAGTILTLRAYGESVGWGFQLQDPTFVILLTFVIFILGLSLFGVFELGTSMVSLGNQVPKTSGLAGSFFSGVLATAIATPCSGPFMGTAIGYTLTLSAVPALIVFTSLALGMAFPYLMLSAFPSCLRFLPKPGNWMVTFKQFMGFPMMATVLWLLAVSSESLGVAGMIILLAGLLFAGMGCWIYGRWGGAARKLLVRRISGVVALLVVACSVGLSLKGPELLHQGADWEPYSKERVAALKAEAKPVFIDFTATWCLTCQANKLFLHSDDVENRLDELGVVRMIGDWGTPRDPRITEAIQSFGRNAVPLYVLVPGDPEKDPVILPEILSKAILMEALDDLERKNVQ